MRRRLNRRRPAPLPIVRPDRPVSRNLRPSRAIARALPDTGCHAQAAAISQPGSDIQPLAIVPQASLANPRSPRSKGAGRRCYEVWVFLWISLWVVKRKRLTGASQSSLCGARRTRDGGSNRRWAVPLGRRFAKRTRRFYAGLNLPCVLSAPSSPAGDGGAFSMRGTRRNQKPEQPVERVTHFVFLCDHPKQSAYRFE